MFECLDKEIANLDIIVANISVYINGKLIRKHIRKYIDVESKYFDLVLKYKITGENYFSDSFIEDFKRIFMNEMSVFYEDKSITVSNMCFTVETSGNEDDLEVYAKFIVTIKY